MPDNQDIKDLSEAEQDSRKDHIYDVMFEVMVEDEDADWVFDSVRVAASSDANVAVAKARAYAFDPEYGLKVLAFRLKGVKILATADIY